MNNITKKPILVLSNELANMISAGEVVERPVSVVKELVENAIDAGSSKIKIDLLDSGLKYISVSDDGIGMTKDEMPVALQRHATSKIASKHDLFSISSLGFRGEALPSIASVSKFRITSSTDGITGYFYEYVNLEIKDEGLIASKKGTKIEVNDLFYNTPARYKHLSNLSQELSNIMAFVNRLAIAYPSISFTVINNGKVILQTQGDNNIENVVSNVYGNDVARNLIKFNNKNSLYQISGYTTKNSVFRSNKNSINIIVNKRIIRNQQIIYAITDAYKSILPVGKYPITILEIETDPTLIDVNVHPSKLEIRFTEEYELRRLISRTISDALSNVDLIYEEPIKVEFDEEPILEVEKTKPSENSFQPRTDKLNINDLWASFNEESINNSDEEEDDFIEEDFDFGEYDIQIPVKKDENAEIKQTEKFEQVKIIDNQKMLFSDLHYIGQYNKTYLLLENNNDLYLIDQHASMERYMYEKILKALNDETVMTYELLVPITIELNSSDIIVLENKLPELEKLGIKAELFGNTSLIIREIPTWIPKDLEVEFIHDIINHLLINHKTGKMVMYDSLAKTMSCKKSIKAHMAITEQEVKELLAKLDTCKMPYTCPHGRPTLVKITLYEIEKMFKRVI